jgi:hypothetical protein
MRGRAHHGSALRERDGKPTTIEAVVSGDRMILKGGIPDTLTVSGEQMTGTADGVVSATITAQRQR